MEKIFEIHNLTKTFGSKKAIDGISFSINKGDCFGLLGPNGAGKSTTIECIEQIIPYDSGRILYDSKTVDDSVLTTFGIQFQETALPAKLNVYEVLDFYISLYNNIQDINCLIKDCNLASFINQKHDEISGGQRQRLLLAVALANKPNLLILDEPTTGLDPQARRNLWELVKKVKLNGTTVILTTHYMDEAFELCDQIAIMDKGNIIANGPPKELLQKHFKSKVIELPKIISLCDLKSLFDDIVEYDRFFEITVSDLNSAIKKMIEHNIDLASLSIREKSLEDLFLHLTGKELRS